MKIVLDTNVLLISISKDSMYREIFDSLRSGKIELAVSNEILLEYEEILTQRINKSIAYNLLEFLSALSNVQSYDVYFHWNLIQQDKDDNKFSDLAVRCNADYLITNDKHFNILKEVSFPPIKIIGSDDFLEVIKTQNKI